jgi:hypothetical protein
MFSLLFTVKGRMAILFVCCASGAGVQTIAIQRRMPRAIPIVFFILCLLAGLFAGPDSLASNLPRFKALLCKRAVPFTVDRIAASGRP